MDKLEELYEQSQRSGITVDDSAFTEAQEKAKDAINKILHYSDDIVDRTDVLEMNGNTVKTLPNAALSRNTNRDIPDIPSS